MRLAIQYALTYPERTPGEFGRLRLEDMGKITFYAPDTDKFPAIPMAYEALREGRNLPIVYNGAKTRRRWICSYGARYALTR